MMTFITVLLEATRRQADFTPGKSEAQTLLGETFVGLSQTTPGVHMCVCAHMGGVQEDGSGATRFSQLPKGHHTARPLPREPTWC